MSAASSRPQSALRMEAAGNRFLVFGGWPCEPPHDAAAARAICALCDGPWMRGESGPAHGLLFLLPVPDNSSGSSSLKMVVHNADGTRAEACGNGLRCAGVWAVARGLASGGRLEIETDAGPRWVQVKSQAVSGAGDGPIRARAGLGPVTWVERDTEVSLRDLAGAQSHRADHLVLSNPHAVVLVDSVDAVPLKAWAADVEAQGTFPRGANVEFLERRLLPDGGLRVRVCERGVGETGSCGTGAGAAAFVARERLGVTLPVDLHFPGGVLRVGEAEDGEAWVEGPVWTETQEGRRERREAGESSAATARAHVVEGPGAEPGRTEEWAT